MPSCLVPIIQPEFSIADNQEIVAKEFDLIIMTQSCDLEQNKVRLAALCPIYSIEEFEKINPDYKTKWNDVRKGRIEGLHLLASTGDSSDSLKAFAVDFREIYSLPCGYLQKRASDIGVRWRLLSPYLEHFSQAFARFFMRVGLPSTIPEFRGT